MLGSQPTREIGTKSSAGRYGKDFAVTEAMVSSGRSAEQQRVAIRCRLGHGRGADSSCGPRTILDNDALPDPGTQLSRENPAATSVPPPGA